ncbi:helix-turn-helix transcriptional regulator [Vibrio cholerae]|nr:helix-turn-helix transcriptional regulator [Vibrio cholerae]
MMQYLDQRIDALKKQLANEAPEVKAINEPAYRFAIRELEKLKEKMMNDIGFLKKIRLEKQITLVQIESELGINKNRWLNIESGLRKMHADEAENVANYFGIDVDDIAQYTEQV